MEKVRPFQVVADDFIVRTSLRTEPLRDTLVQVGAIPLWNRRVRNVANQNVVEGERVLALGARAGGPNESLALELGEVTTDAWDLECRRQVQDRCVPELAADDGGSLEDDAFFGV